MREPRSARKRLIARGVLFIALAPLPGLEPATRFVESAVEQGQYTGAVTLIARRGHIVQLAAHGYRDIARNSPMQTDAIFQIYSMTKPITSVAVLQLMEAGQLTLEDPVSQFLPEFAHLPRITIRHLLAHTAGFAAGEKLSGAAVQRLNAARLDESSSLAAYASGLAALPLANDPGTFFSYDGVNTEVLARVIEVVGGMPFDEFINKRVLAPLRMLDTGFSVPPDKRARIVEMTSTDKTGRLVAASGGPRPLGAMLKRYPSGAGGLYSTAGDYARFCQMLLNEGELDGARILSRKSVELLMATHPSNRPAGQFGWSGAAATWFAIAPHEQLIAILMMQHLPRGLPHDPPRLGPPFIDLVYPALADPR